MIRVTVWNEYLHEIESPEIGAIYPKGIHGCIADFLTANGMETKTVSGVMTAEGYKEFNGFNDEYITADGKVIAPDKVTVKGKGVGHGVGFSAIGSEQLAKDGYNYKYIIGFFFNGTKLLNIK